MYAFTLCSLYHGIYNLLVVSLCDCVFNTDVNFTRASTAPVATSTTLLPLRRAVIQRKKMHASNQTFPSDLPLLPSQTSYPSLGLSSET